MKLFILLLFTGLYLGNFDQVNTYITKWCIEHTPPQKEDNNGILR